MRSSVTRLVALAIVALAVAAGCAPSGAAAIGMSNIEITPLGRVPDRPTEVALFVETGSTSEHCLATLQESQAESPVQELFCAHRTATFDGGATYVEGIWLHLFFARDPGTDFGLWVSAYQEGATSYGTPRLCWTDEGCS